MTKGTVTNLSKQDDTVMVEVSYTGPSGEQLKALIPKPSTEAAPYGIGKRVTLLLAPERKPRTKKAPTTEQTT